VETTTGERRMREEGLVWVRGGQKKLGGRERCGGMEKEREGIGP
jgi:hypothetical protein